MRREEGISERGREGREGHGGMAYGFNHRGSGSVAAGENIQVAGLHDASNHLAAGDIRVFGVVQPGRVELKGAVVGFGAMDAWDDMVLQKGPDGITLVVLEGISNRGVFDLGESVVVGDEDGDVLLEGKIGIESSIG